MVRSQAPHALSNLGKGGINNNDTSKLIHGAKKLGHRLLTLDTPTLDTPTRSVPTNVPTVAGTSGRCKVPPSLVLDAVVAISANILCAKADNKV